MFFTPGLWSVAASNMFQSGDRSQLTRRPDAGIKTRSAMGSMYSVDSS